LIKLSFDFFSACFSSFKIKISAIDIIMVQERKQKIQVLGEAAHVKNAQRQLTTQPINTQND
jgi:hypothetical protein